MNKNKKLGNSWQGHHNSAWHQLLLASNSLYPHERYTTSPGSKSPTHYEQCVGSLMSHIINMCNGCEMGPTV